MRFAVYAALVVALWVVIAGISEPHFEEEFWAVAIAFGGTICIGGGAWLGWHARWARRDSRQLESLVRGESPRDGKLVALEGRVRPLGEPLVAPMSGIACVAYDYTIKEQVPSDSSSHPVAVVRYEGHHLARCELVTGQGPVRLLAFPDLSETPGVKCERAQAQALAERVREPAPGIARLAALERIYTDESGELAVDWKHDAIEDWNRVDLNERVLRPDKLVSTIGIWDEKARALKPSYSRTRVGVSRSSSA